MKSIRLGALLLGAILLPHHASAQPDGKKIFTAMKTLAGTWVGPTTTVPAMPTPTIGDSKRITLRVTSRGHVLVHEMAGLNVPQDEPTKYDHPVTMLYLDENEKLTLVHYCDAGNRPRMTARISLDGKVVDFDFVDVSGAYNRTGHMQHATFTLIDPDHHIEEWTYLLPDKRSVRAHFELHREAQVAISSSTSR